MNMSSDDAENTEISGQKSMPSPRKGQKRYLKLNNLCILNL
jgi:hypothetical protein